MDSTVPGPPFTLDCVKTAGARCFAISHLFLWEVDPGGVQGLLCPQEYSLLFGGQAKWGKCVRVNSPLLFLFLPLVLTWMVIERSGESRKCPKEQRKQNLQNKLWSYAMKCLPSPSLPAPPPPQEKSLEKVSRRKENRKSKIFLTHVFHSLQLSGTCTACVFLSGALVIDSDFSHLPG